ncbi:MAG: long-chain-fatty-acid--CoA ligase [Alphaproteobacteria bacterium]|nr:MAG: long-chain-fatty-acid--CoA ligase [Alphaproteobacteria bacterium]
MLGLMQDRQLLIPHIIEHAARVHGDMPIVTLAVEGGRHAYSYGDCAQRARQLAQALQRLHVKLGDRIATLAWNTYRHVEIWYAVAGIGAIAHTINPRLFDDQIVYIANHAEDRILFFDLSFLDKVEALAPRLQSVEMFVLMSDRAHMPARSALPNLLCYEDLLGTEDGDFAWPELDERTAAGLCYTSGTTGNPKGVLYSHRSNVLHSYAVCMADGFGTCSHDVIAPIVPMFHANAWGVPYAASMVGAKLVLNGPHFDAATLHRMFDEEGVTITMAVPTVWLGLLNHLRETGGRLASVKRIVIGGAAAPRSMIETLEKTYGVEVIHAWGMTELNPLGTTGTLSAKALQLPPAERLNLKCKQGRVLYGVDMKIVDDDGKELPRDGKAFGHLMVRGPWVVKEYFKGEGGDILDGDGYFDTGDVATIDPLGYMQITDRAKDVIKSGGEWISSIDLENLAVGHPDVMEAAVIGVRHPKWDERPLLIVVPRNGAAPSKDAILDHIRPHVTSWWLPDDVAFLDELPHTATGKIQKLKLREMFRNYKLPEV